MTGGEVPAVGPSAGLRFYSAFGLAIASEFPLLAPPAIPPTRADVLIRLGAVPARIPSPRVVGRSFEARRSEFLLRIGRGARMLVREGREILIERGGSSDADIESAFWVSAVAALLLQRGVVALHASAVRLRRGAVLFAGASSSGKSTLLAAMVERGHPGIADDVVAVGFDREGRALALPSHPILHANADTRTAFGLRAVDAPEGHGERRPVRLGNFYPDEAPISEIYLLTPSPGDEGGAVAVEGVRRFDELASQTYGLEYLDGLDTRARHFEEIARLAAATDTLRLTIPNGHDTVRRLARSVELDAFR